LSLPGGWTEDGVEPAVSIQDDGVRRTICDIVLLIFLSLSSFIFDGVDIAMAQKILDRNLKRDPNGVFFPFDGGRLALCRSQPLRQSNSIPKHTSHNPSIGIGTISPSGISRLQIAACATSLHRWSVGVNFRLRLL